MTKPFGACAPVFEAWAHQCVVVGCVSRGSGGGVPVVRASICDRNFRSVLQPEITGKNEQARQPEIAIEHDSSDHPATETLRYLEPTTSTRWARAQNTGSHALEDLVAIGVRGTEHRLMLLRVVFQERIIRSLGGSLLDPKYSAVVLL